MGEKMEKRLHTNWLLIPIALAAISFISCGSVGAGGGNAEIARLSALSIVGSILSPTFSSDVTQYTASVPDTTSSITVIATPEHSDSKVTMSCNGIPFSSSTPINAGINTISVVDTLSNGADSRTYTITVAPNPNLTVTVLDSVNGSILTPCDITATDKDGHSYAFGAQTIPANIRLDPSLGPYTISAVQSGSAVSSYQDVDISTPKSIALYCQPLGMITRPASPVTIVSIQKTANADGSGAVPIGTSIDTSATPYIVVQAIASSGIEATAWSGFGIKIDIDNMPTDLNGLSPRTPLLEASIPVAGGFRTTALFDVSGWALAGGAHKLDVVAYDIANNRAEMATAINPVSAAAGADISTCSFAGLNSFLRVYGISNSLFSSPGTAPRAMTKYGGYSTSYLASIYFYFHSSLGNDQPILGFDVERSSNGGSFAKIGTVNYGSPTIPDAHGLGLHVYWDVDPSLVQGTIYSYRITAFTDATHRKVSGTTSAMIMAPFTASLVGPGSGTGQSFDTANHTGPDFSFSISNPSLWSLTKADAFYFSLLVRDRSGSPRYFGRYRYNLSSGEFQFSYDGYSWNNFESLYGGSNSDYMSYSNGLITIKGICLFLPGMNFQGSSTFPPVRGQDYEWDIFGDYIDTNEGIGSPAGMIPCWFEKTDASGGVARSYADTNATGNDTLNGWFEFSVQ